MHGAKAQRTVQQPSITAPSKKDVLHINRDSDKYDEAWN